MKDSLKNISSERWLEELKKLFLKSAKPSIGLKLMWDLGIFEKIFVEFKDYKNTPQHSVHHPEGNLLNHTFLCQDKMAELLKDSDFSEEEKFMLHLAILCHDLGKPSTTEFIDNQWKSYGHDEAGEEPTLSFLSKIKVDNLTKEKIVKLVIYHLKPVLLYNEKSKPSAVRRLARKLHPASIKELLFVAKADKGGRGVPTDYDFADWIMKTAKEYKVEKEKPKPIISGKELVALGFKPGPEMGLIIKDCDEKYEKFSMSKEEILKTLLE